MTPSQPPSTTSTTTNTPTKNTTTGSNTLGNWEHPAFSEAVKKRAAGFNDGDVALLKRSVFWIAVLFGVYSYYDAKSVCLWGKRNISSDMVNYNVLCTTTFQTVSKSTFYIISITILFEIAYLAYKYFIHGNDYVGNGMMLKWKELAQKQQQQSSTQLSTSAKSSAAPSRVSTAASTPTGATSKKVAVPSPRDFNALRKQYPNVVPPKHEKSSPASRPVPRSPMSSTHSSPGMNMYSSPNGKFMKRGPVTSSITTNEPTTPNPFNNNNTTTSPPSSTSSPSLRNPQQRGTHTRTGTGSSSTATTPFFTEKLVSSSRSPSLTPSTKPTPTTSAQNPLRTSFMSPTPLRPGNNNTVLSPHQSPLSSLSLKKPLATTTSLAAQFSKNLDENTPISDMKSFQKLLQEPQGVLSPSSSNNSSNNTAMMTPNQQYGGSKFLSTPLSTGSVSGGMVGFGSPQTPYSSVNGYQAHFMTPMGNMNMNVMNMNMMSPNGQHGGLYLGTTPSGSNTGFASPNNAMFSPTRKYESAVKDSSLQQVLKDQALGASLFGKKKDGGNGDGNVTGSVAGNESGKGFENGDGKGNSNNGDGTETNSSNTASSSQHHHHTIQQFYDYPQILTRLGISEDVMDTWTNNARVWVHQKVLKQVLETIERVDNELKSVGLGYLGTVESCLLLAGQQVLGAAVPAHTSGMGMSMGMGMGMGMGMQMNMQQTKPQSLIDLAQRFHHLPFVQERLRLEQFLTLPDYLFPETRPYIVTRLRSLAQNKNLTHYKWDNGDVEAGYIPNGKFPTDAELVMHFVVTYLDYLMPGPVPGSDKPFSGKYFMKSSEGMSGVVSSGSGGNGSVQSAQNTGGLVAGNMMNSSMMMMSSQSQSQSQSIFGQNPFMSSVGSGMLGGSMMAGSGDGQGQIGSLNVTNPATTTSSSSSTTTTTTNPTKPKWVTHPLLIRQVPGRSPHYDMIITPTLSTPSSHLEFASPEYTEYWSLEPKRNNVFQVLTLFFLMVLEDWNGWVGLLSFEGAPLELDSGVFCRTPFGGNKVDEGMGREVAVLPVSAWRLRKMKGGAGK